MISKYVKCRTNHVCCDCSADIQVGEEVYYISFKAPRYKEIDDFQEEQIGIEYIKLYYCSICDPNNNRELNRFNFDDE